MLCSMHINLTIVQLCNQVLEQFNVDIIELTSRETVDFNDQIRHQCKKKMASQGLFFFFVSNFLIA